MGVVMNAGCGDGWGTGCTAYDDPPDAGGSMGVVSGIWGSRGTGRGRVARLGPGYTHSAGSGIGSTREGASFSLSLSFELESLSAGWESSA